MHRAGTATSGGGGSGAAAMPHTGGHVGGSLSPRLSRANTAKGVPAMPANSAAGAGAAADADAATLRSGGLGRLVGGALSALFRVDNLTVAGTPAAQPPSPPSGTAARLSGAALLNRLESGRMSAAGMREGAAAAGNGTALAGAGAAAGGAGGIAGRLGSGLNLESALSELTASVEGRLNENQLVIQQVLGSGAFGTVYKALWKGLPVAVKTMTLTSDAVTQGRHAALMEAALSK